MWGVKVGAGSLKVGSGSVNRPSPAWTVKGTEALARAECVDAHKGGGWQNRGEEGKDHEARRLCSSELPRRYECGGVSTYKFQVQSSPSVPGMLL